FALAWGTRTPARYSLPCFRLEGVRLVAEEDVLENLGGAPCLEPSDRARWSVASHPGEVRANAEHEAKLPERQPDVEGRRLELGCDLERRVEQRLVQGRAVQCVEKVRARSETRR